MSCLSQPTMFFCSFLPSQRHSIECHTYKSRLISIFKRQSDVMHERFCMKDNTNTLKWQRKSFNSPSCITRHFQQSTMCFRLYSSPHLKYKLSKVKLCPHPLGTCKSPRMSHVSPGWGFPVTSALPFTITIGSRGNRLLVLNVA